MLCYTILYYIILYYVMLYYIILCCKTNNYTILYYTISYYIVLYYIISHEIALWKNNWTWILIFSKYEIWSVWKWGKSPHVAIFSLEWWFTGGFSHLYFQTNQNLNAFLMFWPTTLWPLSWTLTAVHAFVVRNLGITRKNVRPIDGMIHWWEQLIAIS